MEAHGSTYLEGTMYQPSGSAIALFESTHSPPTLWYTRARASGPSLIGLSSGTNTVLAPQPLAQARASPIKNSRIAVGVHRDGHAAGLEVLEEREDDGRDDAVKHRVPWRPWRR